MHCECRVFDQKSPDPFVRTKVGSFTNHDQSYPRGFYSPSILSGEEYSISTCPFGYTQNDILYIVSYHIRSFGLGVRQKRSVPRRYVNCEHWNDIPFTTKQARRKMTTIKIRTTTSWSWSQGGSSCLAWREFLKYGKMRKGETKRTRERE